MIIKANLKNFTQKFCPFLYDIINNKEYIWNEVSSKFEVKLNNANEKVLSEGGIIIENSLPALLGRAEQGDVLCISFLRFIDSEIKTLYDFVPPHLKNTAIGLFHRLFLEFDKKEQAKPNPTYLNGLSEIMSINKLLKTGDYELDGIEDSLTNNKRADFTLIHNQTKAKSYVEVFNIHVDSKQVEDCEAFDRFMNHRINQKYLEKTKHLDDDIKSRFFLISIIWADDDVAELVKQYCQNFDLKDIQAIGPCSLVQYNKDGNKMFYFGLNE
ncbi:hypothetical protein ACTHQF_00220 [Pedobacter sp. SAFR-022]|uniref:hypothetical protein n=1 Tax=Pedobacter sp. SAFR-022 TaxID=3436861 RepID=UPI003F7FAABC